MDISIFEILILAVSLVLFLALIIILKQKNELEVSYKKEKLENLTQEEHNYSELEKKYRELSERIRELERNKETIYSQLRVVDVSADHINNLNKELGYLKNKFSNLQIQKRDLSILLGETDKELEAELESYKRLVDQFDQNSKLNNNLLNDLYESVKTVLTQVNEATKLIEDDDYLLELELREFSVNKIINSLLEKYNVFIQLKELKFEKNLFDLLPNTKIDVNKFGEAIDIILNNIIKQAETGSSIRVSTGLKEGSIVIKISDKSYLFSEMDIQRAFRKHETPAVFTDGKALNLYLVKKIVEEHKGRISLANDINSGSTFSIQLPIIA